MFGLHLRLSCTLQSADFGAAHGAEGGGRTAGANPGGEAQNRRCHPRRAEEGEPKGCAVSKTNSAEVDRRRARQPPQQCFKKPPLGLYFRGLTLLQ